MKLESTTIQVAVLSATALLLTTGASVASAQVLEETVVTARKIEESIQDAPVAVSSVSSEDIRRENIINITDVNTPNAIINSSGSPQRANISIRGAATTQTDPYQAPAISTIKDGLVSDSFATNSLNIYDTARIEVLRGPQGTLFGRNSVAGVVNITSNRPDLTEFGVDAGIAIENYATSDVRAAINLPVSDTLAVRFAVLKRDSDGWGNFTNRQANTIDSIAPQGQGPFNFPVDPQNPTDGLPASKLLGKVRNGSGDLGMDPGEQDFISARSMVLWEPSEALSVTLMVEYEDGEAGQYNNVPVTRDSDPLGQLGFSGDNVDSGDVHKTGSSLYNTISWDTLTYMGEVNWSLTDGLDLKSVTGYREESVFNPFDIDGYEEQFLDSLQTWDIDSLSQEFTLTSSFSGRLNFVAGAFYSTSTFDKVQESYLSRDMLCQDIFGTTKVGIPVPGPTFGCPIGSFTVGAEGFSGPLYTILPNWSEVSQDTDAAAIYGQFYLDITESLSLTVGGRYSTEEKELFTDFIRGTTAFEEGELFPHTEKRDWNSFTPMVSFDYQFSPDILGYFTWSEGFRSGGFNGRSNNFETVFTPYDEETSDSFELGLKTELWNNRVRVNAALFTTKYDGLQRDMQGVDELGNVNAFVVNAASATVTGFEVELTGAVTEALTVRGSLGLMEGEYDDFDPDLPPGLLPQDDLDSFESFDLPYTPKVTSSLSVSYYVPLGSGGVTLDTTVNYTDEMLTLTTDTPENRRDSTVIWGAGATWQLNEKFIVKAYARNLTDESYLQVGREYGSPWGRAQIWSAPRSYGVSLRYSL